MNSSLMDIEAGATVVLRVSKWHGRDSDEMTTRTVVRVGRKWVYLGKHRDSYKANRFTGEVLDFSQTIIGEAYADHFVAHEVAWKEVKFNAVKAALRMDNPGRSYAGLISKDDLQALGEIADRIERTIIEGRLKA